LGPRVASARGTTGSRDPMPRSDEPGPRATNPSQTGPRFFRDPRIPEEAED